MSEDMILAALEEVRSYSLLAAKEMLTLDDTALLTGLKKSTLRKMIEKGILPYYKPSGKNIFFKKTEINAYLQGNRIPSVIEIIESI